MTTMDKIALSIGACLLIFIIGMAIGIGLGYNDGFKAGFDKALPLTYATMQKTK